MFTADADGRAPRPLRRGIYFRLSKFRVALIVLLFVAPWSILIGKAVAKLLRPSHIPLVEKSAGAAETGITTGRPATTTSSSPFWGELTTTNINIEPPADFATRFARADTGLWYFANADAMKVDQILRDARLPDSQRQDVVRSCTAEPAINGFVARPEMSLILGLSRSSRESIYGVLAQERRNAQFDPFRQPVSMAATWFDDSELAIDTIEIARKLMYRHGEAECLADVSALVASVPSEQERAKLFRTLSRQSAVLATLEVRPTTDLSPLIAYWGHGGRERNVEPLLKSISKLPEGRSLDVARLLPQFARARLLTYPEPVDAGPNGRYDCHWSSLNFFNATPDDTLTNPDVVAETLKSRYHMIERASQLGDVIFLLDAGGNGIHSAAYVADDVVFTKNGSSIAVPWQLMRLGDLEAHYRTIGAVKTIVFRRNDL